MNKKIILLLIGAGLPLTLTAEVSKNPEDMLKEEKSKIDSNNDYFESMRLFPIAIDQGSKTVSSLKANLKHIKRLESDQNYGDCQVTKGRIEKINNLLNIFSKQFKEKKLTEAEYKGAEGKYESEKAKFQQKLNEQKCD